MIAINTHKEMKSLEREAQRRSFSFVSHTYDGRIVRRTAFFFDGWNHIRWEDDGYELYWPAR